jgi:hypothetical protein
VAGQAYQIAADDLDGGMGDVNLSIVQELSPFIDLKNCGFFPDRNFKIRVSGKEGQQFVIQASQDPVQWTSLRTNSLFSTLFDFVDRSCTNFPTRFYRAIPVP